MNFWNRLFRSKSGPSPDAEPPDENAQHAVLIHIALHAEMPTREEMARYHALQDELIAAINDTGAGELDGDEWGGGECIIFTYGPDADHLWDAVAPVLETHQFPRGSFATKRYGGPECERTERINIEWEG